MGFILYLIALILFIPLTIINICLVMYDNIKKHGFLGVIDGYFRHTAIDLDIFGNRNFKTLWNKTLIKHNGVPCRGEKGSMPATAVDDDGQYFIPLTNLEPTLFGEKYETISSVLGKNSLKGTLSWTGRALCRFLHWLDKDHCENSIQRRARILRERKEEGFS